jgi:hypothetical protein
MVSKIQHSLLQRHHQTCSTSYTHTLKSTLKIFPCLTGVCNVSVVCVTNKSAQEHLWVPDDVSQMPHIRFEYKVPDCPWRRSAQREALTRTLIKARHGWVSRRSGAYLVWQLSFISWLCWLCGKCTGCTVNV